MHTALPLIVVGGLFALLIAGAAYGYYRLARWLKGYSEKLDLDITVLKLQREHAYHELDEALGDVDLGDLGFGLGR